MQLEFRGRTIGGVQEYEIIEGERSVGYISCHPMTKKWMLRYKELHIEFPTCEDAREFVVQTYKANHN